MAKGRGFNVLVAADGSTVAKAALATAACFPWPADAKVFGVVAHEARAGYRAPALKTALARAHEAIAKDAEKTLQHRWPGAQFRQVAMSPVEGILSEAARVHADTITIGWRGHGPVRRFLAGSVSRGVIKGASCSVLVVRRAAPDVRRVVLGFDGSAHARRAVAFTAALEVPRGGRVSIVTAVDSMQSVSHPLLSASLRGTLAAEVKRINKARVADAREAASEVAKQLQEAGWKTNIAVTAGAPLRELLARVGTARAQLLVLGARGVGGVERVLLGSVAEGALNRSPVPVLIVR